MHQARDELAVLGVLVVVAALDEAARAVADADDRDADLAVLAPAGARPGVGGRRAVLAVLAVAAHLLLPARCAASQVLELICWTTGGCAEDRERARGRDEAERGRAGRRSRAVGRRRSASRAGTSAHSRHPPRRPARISRRARMTSRLGPGCEADVALEAERLGLGAGVGDDRGGRQRRPASATVTPSRPRRARRRCRRRRGSRRSGRGSSRGRRRTCDARPVARASAPSNRSKIAEGEDEHAGQSHCCRRRPRRRDAGPEEADAPSGRSA